MIIVPFETQWIPKVKTFTDQAIGHNYFTEEELGEKQEQSRKDGQTPSLVITNGESILGLRLTFPHGQIFMRKEGILESKRPFFLGKQPPQLSSAFRRSFEAAACGRKLSPKTPPLAPSLDGIKVTNVIYNSGQCRQQMSPCF